MSFTQLIKESIDRSINFQVASHFHDLISLSLITNISSMTMKTSKKLEHVQFNVSETTVAGGTW